ncbi:MAG: response regulator, partial [Nitrospirota bacterium]
HTYATIVAQRNRALLLAAFGISLIITLTYFMMTRLVSRPIENLAGNAKRLAEGDMSVSADVKTEDEIGVLGNTFNYMVKRISSFSKDLEAEVARRTKMLREKTVLLESANRELKELDRLKVSFLANMSHELRSPMNSIIGYTQLLLEEIDGPINEEQAKSLQKVERNAQYLLQLINDVLDMSKIEAGKIELAFKKLNLKDVLESVTAVFEPSITKKGLTLTISLDEGLPQIYADEDRLRQILINLLSNAIKFTNQGGITISAKPSERGIRQGESPLFVEVCIEDTGIGIKDEDIGKLFDKFVQLEKSITRQYEGTGLGLSIARGLVVLHKGVIWVTSKYGEGSKFCFTIPIEKEILEKPVKPIIEPMMAEALAKYFNKPVETFLKEPEFAGVPMRCWEFTKCGQVNCPAYESKESRCWLVHGTHCVGMKIASYPEKVNFCKRCDLLQSLIIGPEKEEAELPKEEVIKKTVLAIDDNPDAIDIISKYLGKDYKVVGLSSGEGAVEKAKEISPLAITLDIMMPKKDGWQVLQELKSEPETQDIPVIVLSIVDEKKLGFSLGAAEYIIKPFEKQVLLRKLKNLEKMTLIKKVIVVDNETDTIKSISNVLREEGYQVTVAYNSKDAIKSIQASMPDLIVVNLSMPEGSGLDVIEYTRTDEKVKNIPLILLTHKDLTEKEIDELDGRIHGILNKGVLTEGEILKILKDTIKE